MSNDETAPECPQCGQPVSDPTVHESLKHNRPAPVPADDDWPVTETGTGHNWPLRDAAPVSDVEALSEQERSELFDEASQISNRAMPWNVLALVERILSERLAGYVSPTQAAKDRAEAGAAAGERIALAIEEARKKGFPYDTRRDIALAHAADIARADRISGE
jgi:hypothetical protein